MFLHLANPNPNIFTVPSKRFRVFFFRQKMKASMKFRDEEKPIFRAKVPLNILNLPFQSGFEAGDCKDLCLSFSTFFQSGPLIKLSYRPNDSCNPFSVGLKTGIGHFGSPVSAPMTMTAEFNLPGNGTPSFFIHFRPQIGDFAIRRSVQSQINLPSKSSNFVVPRFNAHAEGVDLEKAKFVDGGETPSASGESETGSVIFPGYDVSAIRAIESAFWGVDLSARTSLPLRDSAMLKLRWSLKFPADEIGNRMTDSPFRKMPCLVLNKMGIERVAVKHGPQGKSDVAETCLAAKKELDILQAESILLRRHMEELKSKIGTGSFYPVAGGHKGNRLERKKSDAGGNASTGAGV